MKDALLNEVAEEAVLVLKEKKCEKKKNELKKICETALSVFPLRIISNLFENFLL